MKLSRLLTKLYALYFFATSAFMVCIATLICWVSSPFDRNRRLVHYFSCLWGHHYIKVNPFWKCTFQGVEHIRFDRPYVLVANHQSYWDIMVLYGLNRPYKWVSKVSVLRTPFIGWNMKLNQYVVFERGELKAIKQMLADCRAWLNQGVSIMIFPEGTRTTDGEIGRFMDGPFKLAVDCDVPVIPIVLDGTFEIMPKNYSALRFSGEIKVKVLPAIEPGQFGGNVRGLRDHVREVMVRQLHETRGKSSTEKPACASAG